LRKHRDVDRFFATANGEVDRCIGGATKEVEHAIEGQATYWRVIDAGDGVIH
jgi:ribosomal silencing factor RsfS